MWWMIPACTPGLPDFADVEQVAFETTDGDFVVEVDAGLAPEAQRNFLTYVHRGFYDGRDGLGATTLNRVVPGVVVQGGGQTEDGTSKATEPPIPYEADPAHLHLRGTLAMARFADPDSATSQFFVNLDHNDVLDAGPGVAGYTVFGEVVEGLETLDAISEVPTVGADDPERPLDPIVILQATRLE